ncbi:hypothetical protein F0562_015895 [Nyssa sinensis]|uniref:Uncharacterized protein n=1 Tax=Nyssa sinensis TaxID=561372 RepID=A0A5J4ZMX4_9ASTE|nr:hypothetical protein F0562_015895 [Nyssa sinensis]
MTPRIIEIDEKETKLNNGANVNTLPNSSKLPYKAWLPKFNWKPKAFATLKLIKCLELVVLPDDMSNLMNFRHLNISFSTALLKILPFADKRLLDLPKCVKNLINLRDIDTSFSMSLGNILPFAESESHSNSLSRLISTPPGMGKLTCLQTLFNFVVTKRSGCGIEELKSLVDLRGSLCISKLENVTTTERAKEADLKSKHHLHELTLRWSEENPLNLWNDVHEEGVLECLHPNKNVKVLRIENFGGTRFPSWMKNVSLSNLVSICIINCQKCETLPPLWQLPLLKDLKIHGIHGLIHIGRDFYGDGMVVGFPSLEKLEMKDMPNLEHWSGFEAGEIPCLCELTIWDCPKMTELPNLPSIITTLEIVNCRGFESFPMLHSIQKLVFVKCNEVVLKSFACFICHSSLTISTCTELKYLPDGLLQNLTSLKELKIIDCDELTFLTQEQNLHKLSSLEYLEICCCPRFKSLKDEYLLSTLKSFQIVSCLCLTSLPEEMQHLSTLHLLDVWNCPELSSLPGKDMPASLQLFWVINAHSKESSLAKLNFSVGTSEIKTTLLNHILTSQHGKRIVVIENEMREKSQNDSLEEQRRNDFKRFAQGRRGL